MVKTNDALSSKGVVLIKPQVTILDCVFSSSFTREEANKFGYPESYQSIIPSEQYLIRSVVLMGRTSSNNCQHSRISFLEISDILFAVNNLLPLQEPIRFKIHCFCHCSIITTYSINPLQIKLQKILSTLLKCGSFLHCLATLALQYRNLVR